MSQLISQEDILLASSPEEETPLVISPEDISGAVSVVSLEDIQQAAEVSWHEPFTIFGKAVVTGVPLRVGNILGGLSLYTGLESLRTVGENIADLAPGDWVLDVVLASDGTLDPRSLPGLRTWGASFGTQIPVLASVMVGRAIGQVAGPLIGQIGWIAGPKGAAAGTAAGATLGPHVFGAAVVALQEADDLYQTGIELGLDPEVLRFYAQVAGPLLGAIEYAQDIWTLGLVKPPAAGKVISAFMKKTLASHMATMFGEKAFGVVVESFEEVTQEGLKRRFLNFAIDEHNSKHGTSIQHLDVWEDWTRNAVIGGGVAAVLNLAYTGPQVVQIKRLRSLITKRVAQIRAMGVAEAAAEAVRGANRVKVSETGVPGLVPARVDVHVVEVGLEKELKEILASEAIVEKAVKEKLKGQDVATRTRAVAEIVEDGQLKVEAAVNALSAEEQTVRLEELTVLDQAEREKAIETARPENIPPWLWLAAIEAVTDVSGEKTLVGLTSKLAVRRLVLGLPLSAEVLRQLESGRISVKDALATLPEMEGVTAVEILQAAETATALFKSLPVTQLSPEQQAELAALESDRTAAPEQVATEQVLGTEAVSGFQTRKVPPKRPPTDAQRREDRMEQLPEGGTLARLRKAGVDLTKLHVAQTPEQVTIAEMIARLGYTALFTDQLRFAGVTLTGQKIVVIGTQSAQFPSLWVIGTHEATHALDEVTQLSLARLLAELDPVGYQEAKDAYTAWFLASGGTIEELQVPGVLEREGLAVYMQQLASNPAVSRKIFERNPGLWRRLVLAIKEAVYRLKSALGWQYPAEQRMLNRYLLELERQSVRFERMLGARETRALPEPVPGTPVVGQTTKEGFVGDASGQPVRFYRGITQDEPFGLGKYFTTDPKEAGSYALGAWDKYQPGAAIVPVYLRLKNTLDLDTAPQFVEQLFDAYREWWLAHRQSKDTVIEAAWQKLVVRPLREMGYDSFVNTDKGALLTAEWYVFDASSIVSTSAAAEPSPGPGAEAIGAKETWAERTPENLAALSDAELVAEAKSAPLTHVRGLGMGTTEFLGTYLSAEQEGNRYATKARPAYRAQTDVQNPKVFRSAIDYSMFRIDFRGKTPITPADVNEALRFAMFPSVSPETIDMADLPAELRELAEDIAATRDATDALKAQGYDSVYLPESENNEGVLIVFDRVHVQIEKAPIAPLPGPETRLLPEPSESPFPESKVRKVQFHGTAAEPGTGIVAPFTHFGTSKAAMELVSRSVGINGAEVSGAPIASAKWFKVLDEVTKGMRLIPVWLDLKNPLLVPDMGGGQWMMKLTKYLVDKGTVSEEVLNQVLELDSRLSDSMLAEMPPYEVTAFLAEPLLVALEARGYDGLYYVNKKEDPGSVSYINFRSNQVRSALTGEQLRFLPEPTLTLEPSEISLLSRVDGDQRLGSLLKRRAALRQRAETSQGHDLRDQTIPGLNFAIRQRYLDLGGELDQTAWSALGQTFVLSHKQQKSLESNPVKKRKSLFTSIKSLQSYLGIKSDEAKHADLFNRTGQESLKKVSTEEMFRVEAELFLEAAKKKVLPLQTKGKDGKALPSKWASRISRMPDLEDVAALASHIEGLMDTRKVYPDQVAELTAEFFGRPVTASQADMVTAGVTKSTFGKFVSEFGRRRPFMEREAALRRKMVENPEAAAYVLEFSARAGKGIFKRPWRLVDMRYWMQALEGLSNLPLTNHYDGVIDGRADVIMGVLEVDKRLEKHARPGRLHDPKNQVKMENYIKTGNSEGLDTDLKAAADEMITILKEAEPIAQFLRVKYYLDALLNRRKKEAARLAVRGPFPNKSLILQRARLAYIRDGDAGLTRFLDTLNSLETKSDAETFFGTKDAEAPEPQRHFGLIAKGYTPLERVTRAVNLVRQFGSVVGVTKKVAHLRPRQEKSEGEQKRTFLERFHTVLQHNSFNQHVLPDLVELENLANTGLSEGKFGKYSEKAARVLNNWKSEVYDRVGGRDMIGDVVITAYNYIAAAIFLQPRLALRNLFQNVAMYPHRADIAKAVMDSREFTNSDRAYFNRYVTMKEYIKRHYLAAGSSAWKIPGLSQLAVLANRLSRYGASDDVNRILCFRGALWGVRQSLKGAGNLDSQAHALAMSEYFRRLETLEKKTAMEVLLLQGPDQAARYVAHQVTNQVHFVYDRAQRAPIEHGILGRVVGNLMTFPRSVAQRYGLTLRKMLFGPDRYGAGKKMINLLAGMILAGELYKWVMNEDKNPYDIVELLAWTPGGLQLGATSEVFQVGGDILRGTMAGVYQDEETSNFFFNRAMKGLARVPKLFVPFLTNFLSSLEAATGKREILLLKIREIRAEIDKGYRTPEEYHQAERDLIDALRHAFLANRAGEEEPKRWRLLE